MSLRPSGTVKVAVSELLAYLNSGSALLPRSTGERPKAYSVKLVRPSWSGSASSAASPVFSEVLKYCRRQDSRGVRMDVVDSMTEPPAYAWARIWPEDGSVSPDNSQPSGMRVALPRRVQSEESLG